MDREVLQSIKIKSQDLHGKYKNMQITSNSLSNMTKEQLMQKNILTKSGNGLWDSLRS